MTRNQERKCQRLLYAAQGLQMNRLCFVTDGLLDYCRAVEESAAAAIKHRDLSRIRPLERRLIADREPG